MKKRYTLSARAWSCAVRQTDGYTNPFLTAYRAFKHGYRAAVRDARPKKAVKKGKKRAK